MKHEKEKEDENQEKKAIQEKTHPLHQKFLELLKAPFLDKYINKFSDEMRLSKEKRKGERIRVCLSRTGSEIFQPNLVTIRRY